MRVVNYLPYDDICGAPDTTLVEYERRFGALPFVEANAATILEALLTLEDPVQRKQWGNTGRAHAERYHSRQAGVDRLTPIYKTTHALG